MSRLALIIILFACALPLAADDNAKAESLVQKLASDDWQTRERANRDLVGMGAAARPALRAALEHDDPEVRVRAANALISIGEEFGFAMECATSESEHLSTYGRAALFNLFRIDDARNLRELTINELQIRWRGYNERQFNIMAPPHIALARLQALSGVRVLIADEAKPSWERVQRAPMISFNVMGGIDQIALVRDAFNEMLRGNLVNVPADEQLVARPLRIGRAQLLFITRVGNPAGLPRRCGEQLITDLLLEDAVSARAASMLAEAAGTDSSAADRIREQFSAQPELTRLMWMALALGADDAVKAQVRGRDHADCIALLSSRDWQALELAARYLEALEREQVGEVLGPVIAASDDSLEVMAALWIARGTKLPEAARGRVTRLLSSKDDALAGAAARWFAGADDISDQELELIWKAAEFQPLESGFFTATLELVARPEVAARLVESARKSFTGLFETQQALAAAVLTGRATAEDLSVALDKLNGARAKPRLARRFTALFSGCDALPEEAIKKFEARLFDNDVTVRRIYMEALRQCTPSLRRTIASGAKAANVDSTDQHHQVAHITLLGVLAGAGEPGALDRIYKVLEGEEMELAKAAGAAHADALEGDELFEALEKLAARQGLTFGALAALEGYIEICRRAIANGDRATFRKAYGIAIGMPIVNQTWALRREVNNLQAMMSAEETSAVANRSLPADPALKQADVKIP